MYLAWDTYLGLELMITQHNVLLMETLFLGSMLMIIFVTDLAWEPVSQDLYPWLHRNSISPREVALNLFSLANLVPKLSQDICLGKGPRRTRTTLRHSFHLLLAASWEVCNVPLKLLRQVLSCSLPVTLAGSFLYTCYFNKIYTKLWVIEMVFGPGVKSSTSETMNPAAPFTISYHLAGLSGIIKTK